MNYNLGEYVLGSKIWSGQYSVVRYGMRDGRKFAVKYFTGIENGALKRKVLDCFAREVDALSKLQHKGVVRLVEAKEYGLLRSKEGKTEVVAYLVYDLLDGNTLFDYIRNTGKFSQKTARTFFLEILDIIKFVHSQGFAHLDIGAENVLLDETFHPKLGGFGSASKIMLDGEKIKIQENCKTFQFAAPEQFSGQSYDGERADVFSLGVLLFFMVFGQFPFSKAQMGNQLFFLFCKNNHLFWNYWKGKLPTEAIPENFIDLINSMLQGIPDKRICLEEIYKHDWCIGKQLEDSERLLEFSCKKEKIEVAKQSLKDKVKLKRQIPKRIGIFHPRMPPK